MDQPSQLTESLLFLGFSLLLSAISISILLSALRKIRSDMQKSPEYTDRDVIAVQRQILALLVETPLVLLFFAISRLTLDRPSTYTVFIGLILIFAPLAYLAVSWIRDRIAIGVRSLPVKGSKAVRSGVISLVFLVLSFGGTAIYFVRILSLK
jgi:hypothetical protein